MRLNGLDLNLLIALDAVLTERNITRAAERVFITQPAMSNALARLREHFHDDLVLRSGRKLMLTPRAEGLIAPVRDILMRIESTVAAPPDFDAATATRDFSLLVSDYTAAVLVQPLMQRLADSAPGARFTLLSQAAGDHLERLERGEVDLVIVPEPYRSDTHPSLKLFEETYVCITWQGNRQIRERLSFDDYLAAGHVVPRFGDGRVPAFDGWLMERFGVIRRIEVTVPSLTAVGEMVVGTQRIATVHRRLAQRLLKQWPVAVWPAPLEIPPLVEYAQWNRVRGDDPAIRWLVAELAAIGASI